MKIILLSALLLFGLTFQSSAQKNTVSSGGVAKGIGGSASYSIGQVVYTSSLGTNFSVSQGLQQPYSITIGLTETTHHLEMSIYPNPTSRFLHLKVKGENLETLNYHLFDLQGRVLQHEKINTNEITLEMEGLPKSAYFLKVSDGSKTVKTFKIIKN
jgi:hypothetical protein